MNTKRDSTEPSSIRSLFVGLSFGLVLAVFAYSAVRLVDVVLFPEPNPVVVIWTDRSRFIWRALIALYLGGAAIFGGYRLSLRNSENAYVILERCIFVTAACLALQTILAP